MIRFEHILAKDEDQQYSKPVSFVFQDIFQGLNVASIRETTLSANQWQNEATRLHFTPKTTNLNEINATTEDNDSTNQDNQSSSDEADDLTIHLKPMEIRTFIVQIKSTV